MPMPSFEEQAAQFATTSFKDGLASDGSPTEQEVAAAAANSRSTTQDDGAGENGDENDGQDGGENEGQDGGEGQGGGQQAGQDGKPADKDGKPAAKDGDKGKGKPSFSERIGDLTSKWRGAEREADSHKTRADRAEAELAALKSGKAPLTTQADTATGGEGAPDPSKFDFGELDPKYIAALARYETGQALKAQRAEDDKKRQTDAAAVKQQEIGQKMDAMVKAGVKIHDDYDTVVMQGAREGKWELSPHLGELLLDSEFGHEIAYDLAKNPTEAARVAKLSAAEQAKFLGRQEAKFEAAKSSQGKTPKAPQAPPPPKTPRGGTGASNKVTADTSDFAALERAWKAKEI